MNRRGVTLLELLIATGLLAVLLTVVYGSLHRAWLLRTAGSLAAQRDREARAIVRGFDSMLAQSSVPGADPPANAWQIDLRSHPNSTLPGARMAAVPQHSAPPDCGILGNERCLAVFVDPARSVGSSSTHPAMVKVLILTNGTAEIGRLRSQAMEQLSWRETSNSSNARDGLLAGDVITERWRNSASPSVASARFRVLGDLPWGARFRYFDGQQWYPDWDTRERGDNPRAVELVLRDDTHGPSPGYRRITIPPPAIRREPR